MNENALFFGAHFHARASWTDWAWKPIRAQVGGGSLKCAFIGKRNNLGTSLLWLTQHNQTIHRPLPRLSWFFTTSTISGIPATNVSFQYRISRSRGYRKTTETSTKSSSAHRVFSCPYHWPLQCGEDNHSPASLQYNKTTENFQSGGSWGIPCSRCHLLTSSMWIDWLVQAQSNCTGNVVLQPLLLFTEGMAARGAWYWEWNDIWE